MITGNWGDFVNGVSARIDEIVEQTQELSPSFMSSGLWEKKTTDGLIYRTEGVTGLNYLELFDEGDSIKEDKTYPAYKTEYAVKQSGKTITISQMLMKTRSSELEAKLDEVRQQMIAANRTLNKWAWQVLVDGFTTTDSKANFPVSRLSDAVAMFSASHPSKVGGVAVRSNALSSNPVLSETNLFTGIKQLREMKNGRGFPINYEGKFVLVVPTALEKTALEVAKSTVKSGASNSTLNYYEGIVDVISTSYVGAANGGSDTRWYLFAKDVSPIMKYVSLIDPKIEKTVDFNTKSIRVSIDMACAFGYSAFEHAVGSTGAGS